jgi:beta-galactosidase
VLSLWRAPTDNDGLKLAPMQELKPLGRWRGWGLDSLTRTIERVEVKDGEMTVRALYGDVQHRSIYTIGADGSILINEDVRIPKEIDDLPRIGLVFELTGGFDRLTWLGRGPHESYADRKRGAALGRYSSTVTEQYVPYVMPQEHGGHADTRWFALHDENGRGMQVSLATPFQFSASHFSAADLTAATHDVDLKARPEIVVHVDVAHRGLGTLSCGPDTLAQYRIKGGRYRWTWTLRPFTDATSLTR